MYEKIYNARVPTAQAVMSARPLALLKRCVFSLLQNDVSVSVGSWSENGKEFHSFGAQAVKLCGPKVKVRQASTCKSPRAAERKWRWLVLAVTGTHSSWRYSGAVWWWHLKMIKQSLTIQCYYSAPWISCVSFCHFGSFIMTLGVRLRWLCAFTRAHQFQRKSTFTIPFCWRYRQCQEKLKFVRRLHVSYAMYSDLTKSSVTQSEKNMRLYTRKSHVGRTYAKTA